MFLLNHLLFFQLNNYISNDVLNIFIFLFIFIYLIYCTISDIRTKSISTKISIIVLFLALIINFLFADNLSDFIYTNMFGLIPGLILLIISFISKQSIGLGDGVIIITIGLFYGFWETLSLLLLSLIISSIFSLLILIKVKTTKYSFPFAPFILLGFLINNLFMKGYL